MKYPANPEIIASLESITKDGDVIYHGAKISSIQVRQEGGKGEGEVVIDVRGYGRTGNLVFRFPFSDFTAAMASATLNAERD